MKNKIVIVTAPSGSGKTTIVKQLLQTMPTLQFSVSATTRSPRLNEEEGKDYFFLSLDAFHQKIKEEAFAEYEMVYPKKYYGTLKSTLEASWNAGKIPLVDIDVKGAKRLKENLKENACAIFIQAPSLEELKKRLVDRGTETPESLKERLERAKLEMEFSDDFDHIIINKELSIAIDQTQKIVQEFLNA